MNPTLRKKKLARICKKYGLLLEPKAVPPLLIAMEERDEEQFADLLSVLQSWLAARQGSNNSSMSMMSNKITITLVEQVLEELEGEQRRKQQLDKQKRQQQQQQKLAEKMKRIKQRRIVIKNDEEEDDDDAAAAADADGNEDNSNGNKDHRLRQSNNGYSSLIAASSSLLKENSSTGRNNSRKLFWKIVSAFETPKLVYDSMCKQFRYESTTGSSPSSTLSSSSIFLPLMGSAQDLIGMRTQRYDIVKQKVERYRQEQRLSYLTTIDRLLGTTATISNSSSKQQQQQCTLLGMLKSNPALRCLELEDTTGCIPLRINVLPIANNKTSHDDDTANDCSSSYCDIDTLGVYLEGSMVLVTGYHEESSALFHTSEDVNGSYFHCTSIALPNIEMKTTAKVYLPPSPYLHNTFNTSSSMMATFGGRGGRSDNKKQHYDPLPIYTLSNLSLDETEGIDRLESVIDQMVLQSGDTVNNNDRGGDCVSILVLFGNFCTESMTTVQALEELARILQRKKVGNNHCYSILLLPGPNDVGRYNSSCWPLQSWNKRNTPSSLHPFLASSTTTAAKTTMKIHNKGTRNVNNNDNNGKDNGGNVYLCSNPCRLECADGRQIVLLRKDLIRESLQNRLLVATDSAAYQTAAAAIAKKQQVTTNANANANENTNTNSKSSLLTSRVIHHALSQGHISPSSSSQHSSNPSPIYWNYDHAMTLYPLPDLMIVGLDPEHVETGFDQQYYTDTNMNTDTYVGGNDSGGGVNCHCCRVVSPASKPYPQNEWECAVTTLGYNNTIDVEFRNQNDDEQQFVDPDSSSDDSDEVERNNNIVDGDHQTDDNDDKMMMEDDDEEIFENYRMLGGTQQSQSQISTY